MNKYRDQEKFDKKLGTSRKNIIQNGTTTIVYGETTSDPNLISELFNKMSQIAFRLRETTYVTKGVSQLHPDDTYNQSTGIMIASKKAEMKGRVKEYNKLVKVEDLILDMYDLVSNELDKTEERINKVCSSLEDLQK